MKLYSRKRIDIEWADLAAGLVGCVRPFHRDSLERGIEAVFGEKRALCCLSVRTGFDLYLTTLGLPAGSEVLVSALTIPDMVRILERHGLVPVPVDIEPGALVPTRAMLERAASPRTEAVLVAHLFGAQLDLDPVIALARERGWLVLEDCAQAFAGDGFRGHPGADVSMFSFGPIKTATALAGGVLCVGDAAQLRAMRAAQAKLPRASTWAFALRCVKYAGLKALSAPPLYALLARVCGWFGRELDDVVGSLTRGFGGAELFRKIRRRPSTALLALLHRRLALFDEPRLSRRAEAGATLTARLPASLAQLGGEAPVHTHWVFPVVAADPDGLVRALREAGFDATRKATLDVVGGTGPEPPVATDLAEHLVYVPAYPELSKRAFWRLTKALHAFGEGDVGVKELLPRERSGQGAEEPSARPLPTTSSVDELR
jgi:dTDP-4-amino-4,6-dideoxygalactose transaminase